MRVDKIARLVADNNLQTNRGVKETQMSAFFQLLKFFWNNSQQVLALLEVLPDALQAAGSGMVIAGASATNAGKLIRGNGTGAANIRQIFSSGADVIEDVKAEVVNVKNRINTLRTHFPVEPVHSLMEDLVDQLSELSGQIQDVADALNDVSGVFNDMGNDLKDVGGQLTSVGNELQQIN